MKKIILLFAFTALGYLASNAQTAIDKSQAPHATAVASPQGTLSVVKTDSKDAADSKKDNCTPAEKKNCGKATGGKGCCSKKSEAKN